MNHDKLIVNITLIFISFFLIQCVQKKEQNNNIENDTFNSLIQRDIASIKKVQFEVCTDPRRNYLENQFSGMPFDYFQDHSNEWHKSVPIECIQFAQKNYSGSFALCKNENEKPAVSRHKPCRTEKYTRLVYNAFHDVNECFNLDPKNSFLQIMIESGFHLNALNRTGFDAGLTQFTKNGLHRVGRGDILKRTEQLLLESSNPSCSRISSTFRQITSDSFEIKNRCSVVSLPENPYRALVLHFLHTLRDKMDLEKLLRQRKEIAHLVDDALLEQLVYLAYNRGITGTLRILDGYLLDRKKIKATISREDLDLWKNLSRARRILKNNPQKLAILKTAKIRNLTLAEYAMIRNQNYLNAMAEAGDLVRSKYGSSCF
jgi:hypothetical protein